jgi:uncharacterized protein YbjT (DUF2867 family)
MSNLGNTMSAQLLLTGATGRLGKLVATELNQQGVAWRAFVRRPDAAKSLGAAEIVEGDFHTPASVMQAVDGIRTMILISGDAPDQDVQEINVVNAAKNAGVQHIVKLSAQSAGLTPPVSFGRKHIQVEKAIEQSGIQWTFIRPVFFQQSFLLFADSVRKNNKIILPAGKGAAAFVDARDVAQCLVKVAIQSGHWGKTYTLTGPTSLSFSQAAVDIGVSRNKPVGYIAPPAFVARIVLPKVSGMPRWLAMEVIDLLQAISRGAQANVTNDVQQLLAKTPRSFKAFVQENAQAFR